MRHLIIGLALLFAVLPRPAVPQTESGAYNVEIIVFRTGTGSPDAGGGDRPPVAGDASDTGGGGVARLIGPLPAASLRLGAQVASLRASGTHVPLVHAGWSQTPSPWGSRSGFSLERLGAATEGLAGTAWLERGQYLHLGFSLRLGQAMINEIRRVRLGELNYFDNPDFGVIAVVTTAR
jgi:hypothetical protein